MLGTPNEQHPGVAGREQHSAGYGTAIPISCLRMDPPAVTQLACLQVARGERWPEDTREAVPDHAHTW